MWKLAVFTVSPGLIPLMTVWQLIPRDICSPDFVLCCSSFASGQNATSFAGRTLSPNCPPLEPRAQASVQGIRLCQWIISIDDRGCRHISQDCTSKELFCKEQNEVFWQCSQQCEPTCSDRNPNCRNSCGAPKCQCAPETIRDSRGNCIPKDQCPSNDPPTPQCQFGEVLVRQDCNNRICEQVCGGRVQCNPNCNQLMCLCPRGTFRHPTTRRCVSSAECPGNDPPFCSRDDHCDGISRICQNGRCVNGCTSHDQCSNGLQCRSGRCSIPTCERDSHCTRGTICLGTRCVAGCRSFSDCDDGFACIENQCRRVIVGNPSRCFTDGHCGRNQICINSRCRLGCRNDRQCTDGFTCTNFECVPRRRPECFHDGHCRNNGRCIQGQCRENTPSRCGRGEEFTECGSDCEPSCSNQPSVCNLRCVRKCQCHRGLVRNRFGHCIPRQFC